MTEKIDSSMAEKWIDEDTFVYKGKIYRYDWIANIMKEVPKPEGKAKELKP